MSRILSLLAASLVLFANVGALAEDKAIVANGDMEKVGKEGGWPQAWGKPKSGGSYEAEGGNHFLRLKAEAPGQMTMIYQTYKVPAGTKALELTWRQRVTDFKAGKESYYDARVMIEFKDAKGQKLKGPGAPYTRKATDGWVARTAQFLVPEGAVEIDLMPTLFQVQKGTWDLDDVALKPIAPEELVAKAEARKVEEKKNEIPTEEPDRAKWPALLHVSGNKLVRPDNTEVWLQGVNVVSLEWNPRGEQIIRSTKVAVDDWKSNFIRLPVKESYWFGKEPAGVTDGGQAYKKLVDDVITFAANRGAYVLLDLHRFGSPRAEHAEFWKDAAARYKDHPAVIFDIFNEPHGTTWEVWRNGGWIEKKKKAAEEDAFTTDADKAKAAQGYQAIGMQALVDAVRSSGAKNVIAAGGLDWAFDLSGVTDGYALEEKGGNGIAYSTHIYPQKKGWQKRVLNAAEKYPIIVGECGANTKKLSFMPAESQEDAVTWVPAFLGFVQKYHLHWTAFSLHPKAAPYLLTDFKEYTPTPEWGAFVKRALVGEKFEMDRLR